ncbi:uncharacterized protein si:ch211-149e23.4 [Megalops cyprinoides]|uniref:uncharacterized protein si:ch211-149e23.4 n=1 Tax=Megalops cyprinoides TaxID=118141 RepID=UPI001864FD4D|nr:uncharacterized protein si:ch211-149e23.4 [Megalops cyprinoides]
MAVLALQLLGFVLNIWACGATDVEVERNVTGILGEAAVLRCQYTGNDTIIVSSWTQTVSGKTKILAGYHFNTPSKKNENFGPLASPSNLTVSMQVYGLEAEREYCCSFTTTEERMLECVFLTVLVRPVVQVDLEQSMKNGTHYQTVTCSALSKPAAVIGWLINGRHPSADVYSIATTTIQHPNGTATQTSMLWFPTHLQEAGEVTCAVSHLTLPESLRTAVKAQTFVSPTVTIETSLTGEEGAGLREVVCTAAGGRPAASITWDLAGDAPDGSPEVTVWRDNETDTETVISSVSIQPDQYEGETITCHVTHPKHPQEQQRTVTLPTYHLSSVRVVSADAEEIGPENETVYQVTLEAGQRNVKIALEVTGDVPRYQVTCTKENDSLPAGVEVTGSVLCLEGPVEPSQAGLYTCDAFYYRHRSSVRLEIVLAPAVLQTAVSPPTIKTQTWEEADRRVVECSASDAFPAANLSWDLPAGLSRTVRSSSSFQNGTHSVTSILYLPVCLTRELTVECVVQHPALVDAEARPITLPACVAPDITVRSSTVWVEGVQYTEVECTVDNAEPAAKISWGVEGVDGDNGTSELTELLMKNWTQQNGPKTVRILVRLPIGALSGRDIACVVEHPALKTPDRREIRIVPAGRQPSHTPPAPPLASSVLGVSAGRHKASWLWLAVCEFRGDAASVNLSWVLPENATGKTVSRSWHEGGRLRADVTYEFTLALHEGENLTCLLQNEYGLEEKILHIPHYYISSLRVLNKTTPYQRPQSDGSLVHRIALQPHLRSQRILLRAYGNVPEYNITCVRSDGSVVWAEGGALVFLSEVTQRDTGLYTCHASFYHHSASVLIQVEITSKDFNLWLMTVTCFSTATAVILILAVSLCIFCKRHGGDLSKSESVHKKRESLAALTALLHDPCSPQLKKQSSPEGKCPEYTGLVRYSIVIDVKTTV